MSLWLLASVAGYLVGLVVTFAGPELRLRVVGLALMSAGAGGAVIVAPPVRSWPAAVTVAVTLVPLVGVAVGLRRLVDRYAGPDGATLDDDAL